MGFALCLEKETGKNQASLGLVNNSLQLLKLLLFFPLFSSTWPTERGG